MNKKKLNLINEILRNDYYSCTIEGSLKNNKLVLWSQTDKYADFIPNPKLRNQILKLHEFFYLIKDDGACILYVSLNEKEVLGVVDIMKKYSGQISDDRDFRSDLEKEFDNLLSSVELSAFSVGRYKKQYVGSNNDDRYVKANYLLKQAIDFVKKAHKELV